jgi:hypothetical protein
MQLIATRFGYNYGKIPLLNVFWRPALEQRAFVKGAITFANDGPRFGQTMVQEFLKHFDAPYRYATLDMQAIAEEKR